MAWTQAQLDALKDAYAAGVTSVTHDGKMVSYSNGAEMLKRIRVIEQTLNPSTAQSIRRVQFGTEGGGST